MTRKKRTKALSQNSMIGWNRAGTRPVTRESFQTRRDFDGDSARSPDSMSTACELSLGVRGSRRDAEVGGGGEKRGGGGDVGDDDAGGVVDEV